MKWMDYSTSGWQTRRVCQYSGLLHYSTKVDQAIRNISIKEEIPNKKQKCNSSQRLIFFIIRA